MRVGRGFVAPVALAAALVAPGSRSWAAPPRAYGWWSQSNAGLPVAPPAPPSVPDGGLYIENAVDGPSAISALSISVPSGASVGPLVLHIAGSPVMSEPPVVCPLKSPSFGPAENGAWAKRPAYDCDRAQKVGTPDAGKTAVSFDVGSLVHDGVVAVAVLAGGPADRIAFQAPRDDTLALSFAGGSSDASGAIGTTGDVGTGLGPGPSSLVDALPAAPTASSDANVVPSATASPGAAGPSTAAPGRARTRSATSPVGSVTGPASVWRSRTGQVLGVVVLVLAFAAWHEGYGILGGRVRTLSTPLRRRSGGPSA